MEELKKALEIRQKYMNEDFNTFVEKLEEYICEKIPQKDKDEFKYTGLSNIDFFRMYVEC